MAKPTLVFNTLENKDKIREFLAPFIAEKIDGEIALTDRLEKLRRAREQVVNQAVRPK